MILFEHKGKNKHRVIFTPAWADCEHDEIRQWCEQTFGPGGRNKKCRWRYGWTNVGNVYHFKEKRDAQFFILRWAGE